VLSTLKARRIRTALATDCHPRIAQRLPLGTTRRRFPFRRSSPSPHGFPVAQMHPEVADSAPFPAQHPANSYRKNADHSGTSRHSTTGWLVRRRVHESTEYPPIELKEKPISPKANLARIRVAPRAQIRMRTLRIIRLGAICKNYLSENAREARNSYANVAGISQVAQSAIRCAHPDST